MTVFEYLWSFAESIGGFHSKEMQGKKASKSEMRRWFKNKSVHVNGTAVEIEYELKESDSLVLFPKGKSRTTIR